jgi:hypothetical protein
MNLVDLGAETRKKFHQQLLRQRENKCPAIVAHQNSGFDFSLVKVLSKGVH